MPRGASSSRGRARRKPGPGSADDDDIPEVYLEMLAEADARAANHQPDVDRPVKRRKVGERSTQPRADDEKAQSDSTKDEHPRHIQTVYDLDASDDSDLEWEEVEIQQSAGPLESIDEQGIDEPLHITLDKPTDKPRHIISRRKPVSGAEKKLRLDIHKMHILCLLGHVHIRNLWCNDDEVQQFLKRALLTKQIISFLNPKETMSQFARSTTFIDGLKQASEAFSRNFKTTSPGLRRPHWAEDPVDLKNRAESIMRDAETITSRDDFRRQAKTFRGSRDFGAQMFCALLRSAAVEARLVCSLQVLPFSGVAKGMSPLKSKREYIVISSDDHTSSSDDRTRTQSNTTPPKARRLGQPQFKTPIKSSSSTITFTGQYPFQC
jgi:xeroderma pigmentosum group C-complementing protein